MIAVGSTNKAKILAVEEVVRASPLFEKVRIVALSVPSHVSEQPLTLEETIQGAKNRALGAFSACEGCTYSFGMESGLMEAQGTQTGFLCISVCCIFTGTVYLTGLSTGFEVPPQILQFILEKNKDMTQACLELGISANSALGSEEGLIGILTRGRVDRKQFTKESVASAILQLEHAQWYTRA